MRSPAKSFLEKKLVCSLKGIGGSSENIPKILNVGAGQSLRYEKKISEAGCSYICDRIDIEDCAVDFPAVGNSWCCSVDDMKPVCSGNYVLAFASWVLEHVNNLQGAAEEIYRVLSPSGKFIAIIPNTAAPEFIVSKHTPLWFHKLFSGRHAHETIYAYSSIQELVNIFCKAGFELEHEEYWPYMQGYLRNIPVIYTLAKLYDRLVLLFKWKNLMGSVCIVFRKPDLIRG